jgi:hypothetical protein
VYFIGGNETPPMKEHIMAPIPAHLAVLPWYAPHLAWLASQGFTPWHDSGEAAPKRADLTGASLTGADLTGASLTGADLTGANLEGADLTRAILAGADLRGANLRVTRLTRAILAGADLRGAGLRGAYLTWADLRGAGLEGADLRGAYLTGAYLTGAGLEGADLREAYLAGAILTGAKIAEGTILSTSAGEAGGYRWSALRLEDGQTILRYGCERATLEEWRTRGPEYGARHNHPPEHWDIGPAVAIAAAEALAAA